MICYCKPDVSVPIESIQQEVRKITSEWYPHFNSLHYTGSWKVISLRSPGGNMQYTIPDLINEATYKNTALMDECPSIKNFLGSFSCNKMAVRLLNLTAGSVIREHRDYELFFEAGEARIHIPVFTNNKVEFYLNNELIKMEEGECWYINANLPHRVTNNGETDRIHLVIDVEVNDWVRDLFTMSTIKKKEQEKTNPDLMKIVSELRLQNTETANKLADELEKNNACY